MAMDEGKQLENGKSSKEQKQWIQELYMRLADNPDADIQLRYELLHAVEKYSVFAVRAVLQNSPFESREAYVDINAAAAAVLEGNNVFEGYQRMLLKNPYCMFCDYCKGVYRHKAQDYINRKYKEQKLMEKLKKGEGSGNKKNNGKGIWSPLQPEGGIEEFAPDEWERFIQHYINTGIHYKANPFHIIFWCYSKILSVILGQTNCGSADTWAWKQMKGLSMMALSENFINICNSTMRVIRIEWGPDYMEKLNAPYKKDRPEKVGEIVLTDEFTQENAKNWVARLDKKVIQAATAAIMASQDMEVIQIACLYKAHKDLIQTEKGNTRC